MSQPAVIFGGPSPEHDVSVLTGLQAARALLDSGARPHALYWSKAGDWFAVEPTLEGHDFAAGSPPSARPLRLVAGAGFVSAGGKGLLGRGREEALAVSAALNCCHGGPGEDGSLQAALDLAGVRYSGPDVAGAALGMDKLAFGAVVAGAGLPSLPRVALSTAAGWHPGFDGPYIVKPRFGGSSIGIDVVADAATGQARAAANVHLRRGAVVEPYRKTAYDLNIALRSWPALQLSAVERPERRGGGEILGYADKYVGGQGMVSAPREVPARIDPGVERDLRAAATEVAALVNLRGLARLDFLFDPDGHGLVVNEINTIPGSLAKYLWVEPALGFDTLLADLLEEAERRPTFRPTTEGADGSALRSAGSIAGKLG